MELVNELVSYNNSNVRVIGTYDDPWFCGNDVAKILGYSNTSNANKAIRVHVDDEDKTTMDQLWVWSKMDHTHKDTINKEGKKTIYINESGLYCLILSSRLASAKTVAVNENSRK